MSEVGNPAADKVSPECAAQMLGVALTLVYQRMGSGKLPYRQAGDHRLIRLADIAALKPFEARRQAFAADLSSDTEELEADFSGMPAFSLENYKMQRDPDEADEEYAARRALCQTVWYDIMSKDSENETFEFSDRRAEKEASRREDLERLARGERVDNRFFSVLDRSHAKLIKRRVRLNIPDALAEMDEIDVQVESRL